MRERRRPKRSSTRKTAGTLRKSRRTMIGIVLVSVSILALVGVVGAMIHFKPEDRHADTNCPTRGPVSYTAVLLDATDQVSEIQKISLTNFMTNVRQSIPRDGAIAIYAVNGFGKISKPELVVCNPGSEEQINQLTEGQRLAKRRFLLEFKKPIDTLFSQEFSGQEAPNSPIMEAIQAVSVQSFDALKARGLENIPMSLMVVSDLLQNSNSISFYQKIPSFKEFINSKLYRRLRANLTGVDVEIHFLTRETKRNIQNTNLIKFWTALFREEGGNVTKYKPLTGAS